MRTSGAQFAQLLRSKPAGHRWRWSLYIVALASCGPNLKQLDLLLHRLLQGLSA